MKNCKAATYAKCDTKTGLCNSCDPSTDPSCKYTKDYCDASCKKAVLPAGEYRAVEINKGFARGEWDFTFHTDNTVTFGFGKYVWKAKVADVPTPPQEGTGMRFTLTAVPAAGAPFGGTVGQNLDGLYKTSAGQQAVTKFFYLGLSMPAGPAAADFDDAMTKLEFVLVGCKKDGEQNCDFSKTQLQ